MGTFSVTFTLTEESSPNVGGFNITGNPGDVSIATNISRAALATGVTYNEIDDTLTSFTIASTGQCENSVTKNVITVTPTPTPTPTSAFPDAEFSVSSGSNTSSSGMGTSSYSPTITVINGSVTIRLTASVQTGYQADSTITIPGVGSYSPTAAQGAGNSTFVDFTLGVGVYECDWDVNAISDGTFTVATASLTMIS